MTRIAPPPEPEVISPILRLGWCSVVRCASPKEVPLMATATLPAPRPPLPRLPRWAALVAAGSVAAAGLALGAGAAVHATLPAAGPVRMAPAASPASTVPPPTTAPAPPASTTTPPVSTPSRPLVAPAVVAPPPTAPAAPAKAQAPLAAVPSVTPTTDGGGEELGAPTCSPSVAAGVPVGTFLAASGCMVR